MAVDNCPGNEFGELFFDVLFELAPNMNALFTKSKQILSVKFMEMISTLVSFNNDPVRLEQQSIWLGMRHVSYGARPQHTQVCSVLLGTVAPCNPAAGQTSLKSQTISVILCRRSLLKSASLDSNQTSHSMMRHPSKSAFRFPIQHPMVMHDLLAQFVAHCRQEFPRSFCLYEISRILSS